LLILFFDTFSIDSEDGAKHSSVVQGDGECLHHTERYNVTILCIFITSDDFVLHTDASGQGLGEVLSVVQE